MKIDGIVTILPARTGQKADGTQFVRPAFTIQHGSESMYFDCSAEKFDELTRQGFANGASGELRFWASTSNYQGRMYNNFNPQSWLPAAAQPAAGAPAQAPVQQPYAAQPAQPTGPYTQLAQMQGQQQGYVPTQQPMQTTAAPQQQNYPFPPPPANL